MRVVDSSALSWEQISGHRVGSIEFKRLLTGSEARKDNYEFSLVKQEGEFHSPVHRHNFDQVRVPLHGRSSYGKNQFIRARSATSPRARSTARKTSMKKR
jgi:hypothetical protein